MVVNGGDGNRNGSPPASVVVGGNDISNAHLTCSNHLHSVDLRSSPVVHPVPRRHHAVLRICLCLHMWQ